MSGERVSLSVWRSVKRRHVVIIVVAVAALVVGVSLPGKRSERSSASPVREAMDLVRSLDLQLGQDAADDAPDEAGREAAARHSLRRDIFSSGAPPTQAFARSSEQDRTAARTLTNENLVVSAILLDGDSRQAVIAGRRVSAGDSVAGYWVVEISRESVLLWNESGFRRIGWRKER